jgi:Bacterial Ig domain
VGTLTLDSSGNFTFTAPANASGATSFTVKAFDQVDYSAPATVTVQITAPSSGGSGGGTGGTTGSPSSGGGGGGMIRPVDLALLLIFSVLAAVNKARLDFYASITRLTPEIPNS